MRAQRLPAPPADGSLKVLVACDHASARYGGEAILPLHHYRLLRERGVAAWLVAHARSREELAALFPGDPCIHYVEETLLDRWMWRVGRRLPAAVDYWSTGFVARIGVQLAQRRQVRRLVGEHGIDVVHQPIPVSPREPSLLYDVGAPVIIGPMNGGMRYPPAFRASRGPFEAPLVRFGAWVSPWLNRLMPGKRKAALLLVANERTRAALPRGIRAERVDTLVENGVELDLWTRGQPHAAARVAPVVPTFVFVGRLIRLKAVDLLLEALAIALRQRPMRLVVIGDGSHRAALERQVARLFGGGAASAVHFTGGLTQTDCAAALQDADALVMPSLHDCGGAVVLEAMAMGLPVIATAWGGPLDYLDPACGRLVEPRGRAALIDGFAAAMLELADSPEKRAAMGRAARLRAKQLYDWNVKGEQMMCHYRRVAAEAVVPARTTSTGKRRTEPGFVRPEGGSARHHRIDSRVPRAIERS